MYLRLAPPFWKSRQTPLRDFHNRPYSLGLFYCVKPLRSHPVSNHIIFSHLFPTHAPACVTPYYVGGDPSYEFETKEGGRERGLLIFPLAKMRQVELNTQN